MESIRIGKVADRIYSEKRYIEYSNGTEVEALEKLNEHLKTPTDYVFIFVVDPPSANLITAFSSLPQKIQYIYIVFGFDGNKNKGWDWSRLEGLLEAVREKEVILYFMSVLSEEFAKLFGRWNLIYKIPYI